MDGLRILVTGATGYVGGRLVPLLVGRGHRVRVLARDPDRAAGAPWAGDVEVVRGDVLDPPSLQPALAGVDVAYYLVHSMGSGGDFAERDRRAARVFAAAARDAACHVVYLGGLVPAGHVRSEHLTSRAEVGALLREGCEATELRAGPVIGSGSASFEMVRYLTERLPLMVAPRWIRNPVQPIAVDDVLGYLVEAGEGRPGGVLEVGADVLTFRSMMEVYAEVRGLRRVILPVPVLAPSLAARWVGLVTPIPNRLAVPLIEGVLQPVTADTERALRLYPGIEPIPYREAVRRALEETASGAVITRWSGALGRDEARVLQEREGLAREVREVSVAAAPDVVYRVFSGLGGERGWPAWSWAWRLRGLLDRVAGGPGLRRGRRHPDELRVGEAVDFWRAEVVEPPERLRLRAEMRLPGRAWLQWETRAEAEGTRLVQTAYFAPRGLPGLLYWYGLYPAHAVIFGGLVRAIARRAERLAGEDDLL